MGNLDAEEFTSYLINFICNKGLYREFLDEMIEKGFTEEELEDL